MSSKEILQMFWEFGEEELTIEDIINITFTKYKEKKKNASFYNSDDFIPQNLIKLYFSKDANHSDFKDIVSNFKKRYLEQESKLEGVHSIEEIEGLGLVYDYIRSDEWKKCANIYIIYLINLRLFSQTPYPEAGGKIRNSDCYLRDSSINTCPYNQIDKEIAKLYFEFQELIKRGCMLGEIYATDSKNKENNEDNLIDYINDCLKIKCKLIQIHPFSDGNGRTMRAMVNLLFKLAGIPPIYVKHVERSKYLEAMGKAIEEGNFDYINKFYYYKICDSILTLDVNKRIRNDVKLKQLIKNREEKI